MKKHLHIILLVVYSLFTVKPLFNEGLFPIHDDTQPGRIVEMKKALSELHLPVRWSPDLGYGYGYPLFNFYAPFPYYLGGLFLLFTKNVILATKVMFLIGTLISGITMYILVRKFFDKESALLAGILYSYAPYHAVQIYVRGSVGEYFAYGLIPLCIWSLFKSQETKSPKHAIIYGIPLALIILSHNIVAMLFIGLIILQITILSFTGKINRQGLIRLLASLLFGLSLSAFFWLPAIYETSYTAVNTITQGGSKYIDHFLFLDQLWDSPWGYAGSAPGRSDGMSFKIGKINIILALIGTLVVLLGSKKKSLQTILGYSSVILLVTSIYMTTELSYPLWQLGDGILKYVQFPWRFLTFINFGAAFLASFTVYNISSKKIKLIAVAIIINVVVILQAKYFQPQYYTQNENSYYTSSSYLKWTASRISDEYLPSNFEKPKIEQDLPYSLTKNTDLPVEIQKDSIKKTVATVTIPDDTQLIFNKTYSPNWQIYIDDIKKEQVVNNKGLLTTDITKGSHKIEIRFSETFIQQLGNIIALIGILTLAAVVIFNNKWIST